MHSDSLSRRDFVRTAGLLAGGAAAVSAVGQAPPRPRPARRLVSLEPQQTVELHAVATFVVSPAKSYTDPYNEVDVDFTVTAPDGSQCTIPAYLSSGSWYVHFSGTQLGAYTLESKCSVADDTGLNGVKYTATVVPYTGDNALYRHGRLRAAQEKRHLEHLDGTPFLWIGDTWWMGLCNRLDADGFTRLLDNRKSKGFSLVQIIAGPYPDMDAWDERGVNGAGFPFEKEFARLNTRYYDEADDRIVQITEAGIVPCIVGMWGYYLPQIGLDKINRYWRYIVARYAAYPVVWCICGEATMPYYLSKKADEDVETQKNGWTDVMKYVRELDPYHNPITIHPTQFGHDQVNDPSLMDVDMLQTGHSDIDTIPNVIKSVREAVAHEPKMPVVNGEVNYEGIMGRCWQNIVRLGFYHTMLNGAAGFTYGANGIWQINERDKPYGPSPHGRAWGNTPWEVAMNLPGSAQVGYGGRLLARYPWWEMQRQPDWIDESKKENDAYGPVAAGIPRKLRIVYSPMCWNPPTIKSIEADVQYSAFYFDPVKGQEITLGQVKPDAEGKWTPPFPPEVHDWVIVLEAK